MLISFEFDGVIVRDDTRAFDDLETPLELVPGASLTLRSLRRAGHILLLCSDRANRALRVDPRLDPLVTAGVVKVDPVLWKEQQGFFENRYQEMLAFVLAYLPGVFHAIDDGLQGKPVVDLHIDAKARAFNQGGWPAIMQCFGYRTRRAR
jgi:hypothetical protein